MTSGLPDVVVATAGRPSLARLLDALGDYAGRVLVVDDRPRSDSSPLGGLDSEHPVVADGACSEVSPLGGPKSERRAVEVLRSGGRGPAVARNAGWRAATSDWVCFLDDDVVSPPGWAEALRTDLAGLGWREAASQGRVHVPLPDDRRPTDWERNVAGLQDARWATADMAVRRSALAAVGGFDERFPRAYREDADLGLRLEARGLELVRGTRCVEHPVGPAPRSISVTKQRGNADDALMDALHGRGWRERAGAPRGRLARHAVVAGAGVVALGSFAAAASRPRPRAYTGVTSTLISSQLRPATRLPEGRTSARTDAEGSDPFASRFGLRGAGRVGAVAGGLWLAGTAELVRARIAPGPQTREEVATMLWTSAALPFAATYHRLRGEVRARRLSAAGAAPVPAPPLAVLLDRDDTLVHDVPYNGDPELLLPMPGVARALDRLRERGIALAVVSNQSGIARGLLSPAQTQAVMDRLVERLGPFDDVRWCPHGPDDACTCRKPRPGMLLAAAEAIGVDPLRCAMVGDIGADVEAARAAGMRGILVPTDRTRPEEVAAAAEVAPTFEAAVALLLAGEPAPEARLPVGFDPSEAHRRPAIHADRMAA